jgi:hypothetical protein
VSITLGTYSHWFQQRTESSIASKLSAFLIAEAKEGGSILIVQPEVESRKSA